MNINTVTALVAQGRTLFASMLFVAWACSGVAHAQGVVQTPAIETASIEAASVRFDGVQNEALLSNLFNFVELYQRALRVSKKNPIQLSEWQRLDSNAEVQIRSALKPYGFYAPRVTRSVSSSQTQVIFDIALGQTVILTDVDVTINGSAINESAVTSWLDSYPLKVGQVLVQPDYDEAKSQLNQILRRLGYFDAEFIKQEVVVNADRITGQISLEVNSGQRYSYGEFEIDWSLPKQARAYSLDFLSRYLTLSPGDDFDSQALQTTQRDMSGSAYFSQAELRPLLDKAEAGVVPIRVTIQAPRRLAYGASLGFGTDTGARAGLIFENRRVNTLGHKFNSELNTSIEKQTVVGNYTIPSNGSKRNGLNLFTSFINEDSDVRDSAVWVAGFDFNRSHSEQTQLNYGLNYRDETFVESDSEFDTQLLLPSISWQTVSADDLRNPSKGYRISASLRAADVGLGSDISFAQLSLNAKSVYSIGSGRVLGRVQVGQTYINDDDRLPSSLSFFAGGDHSVRGYEFESIGVADDDGDLIGGQNLVAASIEYEQQIKGAFALAAFIDAGDAYDNSLDLKVGIGVGARWRLPFGAVRLDIASARDLDGEPVRLHFTFGTDL
ncbi:MAG: translocation and assembly module TamA [Cryomorphaceae bacterium]|jgi:translocation and assembly module TamA